MAWSSCGTLFVRAQVLLVASHRPTPVVTAQPEPGITCHAAQTATSTPEMETARVIPMIPRLTFGLIEPFLIFHVTIIISSFQTRMAPRRLILGRACEASVKLRRFWQCIIHLPRVRSVRRYRARTRWYDPGFGSLFTTTENSCLSRRMQTRAISTVRFGARRGAHGRSVSYAHLMVSSLGEVAVLG